MSEIDYEAARSGKRPVRTQRGDRVRLISDEGAPPFPLVGLIEGELSPSAWDRDGRYMYPVSDLCLVQDPEVIEFKRWVNVSKNYVEGLFDTYELACMSATPNGITAPLTIRITGDKVEISGGTE